MKPRSRGPRIAVALTFDEWDEVTDLLHSIVEDPGTEGRAARADRLNGRILRQVNRGLRALRRA